ncbi:hypothetical protein DRQ53_02025 [bacterium]|nr:MAG: hypothetical protein DRQ53_02025 [bacterium]
MSRNQLLGWATAFLALTLVGDAHAVSQAGAIHLTFPIGARYNALGESGTALAADAAATWWNPGGFAFAADKGHDTDIEVMQSPLAAGLADDVNLYWMGGGTYVDGWGMFGGSITYLDQGDQQAQGTNDTDDPEAQSTTFASYEFSVNLSWGFKFTEDWGAGMNVKYIRIDLAPASVTQDLGTGGGAGNAQSIALDLGVRGQLIDGLWFGASLANLGPDLTFIDADQSDPLPFNARTGLAYDFFSSNVSRITGTADALVSLVSEDDTMVFSGGVEWAYSELLFIWGGYKHDDEGDIKDYTAGAGVDFNRWVGKPLRFGYASVPQAEGLDRVNRFTLGYSF